MKRLNNLYCNSDKISIMYRSFKKFYMDINLQINVKINGLPPMSDILFQTTVAWYCIEIFFVIKQASSQTRNIILHSCAREEFPIFFFIWQTYVGQHLWPILREKFCLPGLLKRYYVFIKIAHGSSTLWDKGVAFCNRTEKYQAMRVHILAMKLWNYV